jgi:hypothetical protein
VRLLILWNLLKTKEGLMFPAHRITNDSAKFESALKTEAKPRPLV